MRERKEDITLLVNYFLKQAEKQQHKKFQISTEALAVLENYHFSGNVRELENSIQRALVTATDGIIDVTDLPKRILQEKTNVKSNTEQIVNQHDSIINIQPQPIQTVHFSNGEVPQMTLQNLEKLAIESSITRNSGNMSVIANELGIGRTTLYRKIKEYELTV